MFAFIVGLVLASAEVLVKLDPLMVQVFGTIITPVIVGAITKKFTTSKVKLLTNAVAVAIVTAITAASVGDGLTFKAIVLLATTTFILSNAAHQFMWKPLGISEAVSNLFPDKGIGSESVLTRLSYYMDQSDIVDLANETNPLPTNAPHGENPELIDPDDVR
jgi:hypothetical protein